MLNELLNHLQQSLWQGFLQPFGHALDPANRMFWLFCFSSAGFVFVTLLQRFGTKRLWRRIRVTLFSKNYWWHRSSLVDVSLLFTNSMLRLLVLVPLISSQLAATILVARYLQSTFGNAPAIELPWYCIAIIYTLVFFLLEDLSRFSLHVAMHKVPILWRLHRVHHSAAKLTPLTLFRVHPLEMSLYYCRGVLVFGLVSGVFVYIFGKKLSGLDILGVDMLGFAFNFFAANLRHSHIWLSFGKWERWFVSPAQHQIHHSSALHYRDKNFGTCLAIWDKLLGSLVYSTAKKQRLKYGIANPLKAL